jgi:basic membrane lipoprotein Med (substrate-binding protein (PBP1-ABC) superfamily)
MHKLLIPALLIALALLFVACGGQQAAEPTEPAAEPAATEEETTQTEGEGEGPSMTADIESVCLVTDVGRVNDGTFNEYAYNGMTDAAEDFGLESDFIETQSQADYNANLQTCLDEEFDILVTVGFLIADATLEAAQNNPDTFFIGVDQFFEEPPDNLVGIQFREDQGGFLAGAMAGMMTESGTVGASSHAPPARASSSEVMITVSFLIVCLRTPEW